MKVRTTKEFRISFLLQNYNPQNKEIFTSLDDLEKQLQ